MSGRTDPESQVASNSVRVMHLITGLDVGGAETMLAKLLANMDRKKFQNVVYSMIDPGPVAGAIRQQGVQVYSLGMKRGIPDPGAIIRLVRGIHQWRPKVLQTWMYHADLLGGISGKLFANVPVVWNIRHGDLRPGADKATTFRVARICALLSSLLPTRIVCCAEASRRVHVRLGYRRARTVVIPNGFDLERYRPEADARVRCETHFGIPENAEVVSLIARYDPVKDHRTFVEAARLFAPIYPNVLFVLCGAGIDETNTELLSLIKAAGILPRVVLLGRRRPEEIALIMSRSALVTSTSVGEGFSNVIGEAMACGKVCVVTDVGDSAYIVGDHGIVVQPCSPLDLANGWTRVMSMHESDRVAAGLAARHRVEENFSIGKVASRYQDLYSEIVRRAG